jgi:outer membrane receptor protein involved in Fe transport
MRHRKILDAVVRSVLLAGITFGAALGHAQQTSGAQSSNDQGNDDDLKTVVVTGSRIPVRDTTGTSPIVTVSGETLAEIGTATIETYLNALPMLQPGLTKTNNNPTGGGAAFLNLRDLGTARGLTLVDGRRIVPGSSGGAVDVSVLPSAIIERVEVITGGASAVYGADAVSGVVNFLLRDEFEGLQFSGQYGKSAESDGLEYNINVLAGAEIQNGRGHVTFAASYTNREEIYQSAREFSKFARYCDTTGCFLNGSPTTGDGTFSIPAAITSANLQVLRNYFIGKGVAATTVNSVVVGGQRLGFNPDGSLFIAGRGVKSGDGVWNYKGPNESGSDLKDFFGYNFNPVNLIQSPFERHNFYTNYKYDLTDNVELYGNALFSTYDSQNSLAEAPAGFNVSTATTVTMPTEARTVLANAGFGTFALSRRTVEFGPRLYTSQTDAFQLMNGLRGTLPEINGSAWKWDVYASYGKYENSFTYGGFPQAQRIAAALAGCAAGSPPGPFNDRGVLSTCVPFNPFGAGSITKAQRDYIEAKGQTDETDIEQTNIVGSVAGELMQLPAGGVGFALGAEYRELSYRYIPPEAIQTGSLLGANSGGPVGGGFDVKELFGEVRIPVLADMKFVEYLGLEGGYRTSDYNTGVAKFTTETYKFGGEYAPIEGLRFRALQQRAIRAPSLGELFATRSEGFPSAATNSDPCDKDNPARTGADGSKVLTLCQAQNSGINAAFDQVGSQYRTFSGGNPSLTPEIADSLTVGFVVTPTSDWPTWMQNFSASVDYWDIDITNVVSSVGFSTSLARCYSSEYNPTFEVSNVYCQNISRDPATGQLTSVGLAGYISQTNANLADLLASGVDIAMTYRFEPTRIGNFQLATQATWYENQQFRTLPGNPIGSNAVGFIGDGTPGNGTTPKWKVNTRLAWNYGDFSASLRWQFIDNGVDGAATATNLYIPGVPAYHYFYLNGTWQVTDAVSVFAGIDNVTDKQPPIYTRGFQYGTDPSTYDVIGRYMYVGARMKF